MVVLALGIALLVQTDIGLGPWGVLHQGVGLVLDIAFGTAVILVGLVVMLLWLPLRERPGPGTLINVLGVGLLINLFLAVLPSFTDSLTATALLWPALLLQHGVGVVLMGIGTGLYLDANLGAGPRDGVMMGLIRVTGRSVRLIRTSMELTALGVGWLLGGTVGIGTLIFALSVGHVVQTTLHTLRRWRGEPPAPDPSAHS
jgi:uncharacterized membrane protein YczE